MGHLDLSSLGLGNNGTTAPGIAFRPQPTAPAGGGGYATQARQAQAYTRPTPAQQASINAARIAMNQANQQAQQAVARANAITRQRAEYEAKLKAYQAEQKKRDAAAARARAKQLAAERGAYGAGAQRQARALRAKYEWVTRDTPEWGWLERRPTQASTAVPDWYVRQTPQFQERRERLENYQHLARQDPSLVQRYGQSLFDLRNPLRETAEYRHAREIQWQREARERSAQARSPALFTDIASARPNLPPVYHRPIMAIANTIRWGY